jgi:hypothetical protein
MYFLSFCRLPLVQSRQKFSAMDLVLRQEFHSMIAKLADKYQLHDIVFASFTLQYGFRNRYCAADVVYAMLATLEFTVSCIFCLFVLFLYPGIMFLSPFRMQRMNKYRIIASGVYAVDTDFESNFPTKVIVITHLVFELK